MFKGSVLKNAEEGPACLKESKVEEGWIKSVIMSFFGVELPNLAQERQELEALWEQREVAPELSV